MDYVALGPIADHVAWCHVTLGTMSLDPILTFWATVYPSKSDILKTHRIIIIFVYFMGNYAACKNCTKKEPRGFKNFPSMHFELITKTYVAFGTGTLFMLNNICYVETP